MKKSLLKPVFMSLVVLCTAVAITPSFEKITEASYNQTEGTDDPYKSLREKKNVVEISRNQMQDMSRNPFRPLVLTEEQSKKLYNDGVFSKEDVEKERKLRDSLEEKNKETNCDSFNNEEKSDIESNCSDRAKYFFVYPKNWQKNVE